MAFYRDYSSGLRHQLALLPKLQTFFNDDVIITTDKFNKYDYEGKTASYELKARNNEYKTYPTTCIAQDKINPLHPKRQVYVFHFTDGTYFIEYEKDLFASFEVKPFRRWRTGVHDKEKPYVYIPIDKLSLVK